MRAGALVLLAALALAGCDSGDDEAKRERSPAAEPAEAKAIRSWSAAVNAGRYRRAASFFAEGAIVEQIEEVRLRDREAAIAFNRGLPCRADVTEVRDEGRTVIAAFRLRDGPGGPCEGDARVRFRLRDGKFTEWRQLSESPAPPGVEATILRSVLL